MTESADPEQPLRLYASGGLVPLIGDEGVTMVPVDAGFLAALREMADETRTFRVVDQGPA